MGNPPQRSSLNTSHALPTPDNATPSPFPPLGAANSFAPCHLHVLKPPKHDRTRHLLVDNSDNPRNIPQPHCTDLCAPSSLAWGGRGWGSLYALSNRYDLQASGARCKHTDPDPASTRNASHCNKITRLTNDTVCAPSPWCSLRAGWLTCC